MRLVWVVIPLVLIGIIGMQESIAEESAPIPPPKGSVDYTISNLPKLGETAEITITATLQFLDTFDSRLGIHFDKSYFEIVSGDLSYVGENLDYDGKAIVAYGKNIIYLKDQPQTVTVTVKAIKTGLSEITISSGLDYAKHSIDMVIGESETRYATDEDFMQIFEAEKAKRLAEYGETLDNCDNLVQLPSGPDFIINSTSQYVCNDSKIINTLSPKKQLEFGVTPVDIICKEGLELVFKSSDNSPVCVKPETAEKLIERGWTIDENDRNSVITVSDEELEIIWQQRTQINEKLEQCKLIMDNNWNLTSGVHPSFVLDYQMCKQKIMDDAASVGINMIDCYSSPSASKYYDGKKPFSLEEALERVKIKIAIRGSCY